MLSTDVELPRDFDAKFPDHCIRCHGETFRHTLKLSTRDLRLSGILFWFLAGKKISVEVPCCEHCGLRMKIQRWCGGAAIVLLLLVSAFLLFPLVDGLDRSIRKYAMLGVGILCVSPVLIWEVFWPPTLNITSTKNGVTYEFQDPKVAQVFAKLNDDADWVEVS